MLVAESVIYVYDCDDLGVPDAGTRSTFLDLTDDDGEPDVCHSTWSKSSTPFSVLPLYLMSMH